MYKNLSPSVAKALWDAAKKALAEKSSESGSSGADEIPVAAAQDFSGPEGLRQSHQWNKMRERFESLGSAIKGAFSVTEDAGPEAFAVIETAEAGTGSGEDQGQPENEAEGEERPGEERPGEGAAEEESLKKEDDGSGEESDADEHLEWTADASEGTDADADVGSDVSGKCKGAAESSESPIEIESEVELIVGCKSLTNL